jgi:hypothetical protein
MSCFALCCFDLFRTKNRPHSDSDSARLSPAGDGIISSPFVANVFLLVRSFSRASARAAICNHLTAMPVVVLDLAVAGQLDLQWVAKLFARAVRQLQ